MSMHCQTSSASENWKNFIRPNMSASSRQTMLQVEAFPNSLSLQRYGHRQGLLLGVWGLWSLSVQEWSGGGKVTPSLPPPLWWSGVELSMSSNVSQWSSSLCLVWQVPCTRYFDSILDGQGPWGMWGACARGGGHMTKGTWVLG